MRAWVVRRPGPVETSPLEMADVPEPQPGPGEVVLRVRACGVCRTDLHVAEGDLPPVAQEVVPGHQIVGEVTALGEGVRNATVGERVGVGWLASACGRCAFCASGRENLCDGARFTGYHVSGGFAEYAVAKADYVYSLPDVFSDTEAAPLLCAGVIGYRALRLAEARRARSVGLFGFGASAGIAIQIAGYWGLKVYVFTRGEERRQAARDLGAAWAGGAEDDPGTGLDSAIIFAPAGELVPLALGRLDKGGTLAINAVSMAPIPGFGYERLYGERTVRSVANATRQNAIDFLDLAARIPVRTQVQTYGFADANRALLDLKKGRVRGAAVLSP